MRGTKTGTLPAGGHVDNLETAKYGGWDKVKILPQGGIVGDSEKARFGGLERVTNLKPNSQGAISDTPASDAIKSKGGHFTPDNKEITGKEGPETNVQGSDAIHPMQVQQLGNTPIEDDGTTRNGEVSPPAATAGVEGGSAPESGGSHPLDTGEEDEENLARGGEPEEVDAVKEPEGNKGIWGIPFGKENAPAPEDENEEEEDESELETSNTSCAIM